MGCSALGPCASASASSTWSSLLGYSRVTWPRAMRAKLEASSGVRRGALAEGEDIHQHRVGQEHEEGGRDLGLDHRIAVRDLQQGWRHQVEVGRERGHQRAAEA